jgi:catechol 2,3-dioxygenase-like lactoylglutathione lyase family enzyme
MKQTIAQITLLVKDYDEAIAFYTGPLGFSLLEDTQLSPQKRWVRIAPPGATETSLLLVRASGEEQEKSIGNQTGGRVAFFLYTDDFERDYQRMKSQSVRFLDAPRKEAYGTVAVFADLYGNLWDLIQPKK